MVHNLSDKHSLVSNWLSELRDIDVQQDRLRFRRNLEKIGEVSAYEISKHLTWIEKEITTPLGISNCKVLEKLNSLEYYKTAYPKSLANSFGTDTVFPIIKSFEISTEDALATYTEHICIQIKRSLVPFQKEKSQKLFITGGGAFNDFLIERLKKSIEEINFEIYIPEEDVVKYKEALIMALIGVLRWREQYTVLASVTGAVCNSIGGALWLGTEA